MKSLKPPDSHHLSAAIGWLELGDWRESNKELEKISAVLRTHSAVLEVRYQIFAKAGNWDMAAETAHVLNQDRPLEARFWIWRAYAARRMSGGGIAQAREILLNAQPLFPKESVIPYNLACYACQLGDKKEARKWLAAAFDLGDRKKLKLMALDDLDLEPLRAEIGRV